MKLYTEEQLVRAMSLAVYNKYDKYIEVLDLLNPIEIPTEEIVSKASCGNIDQYHGAMWIRNEIIKQTKK